MKWLYWLADAANALLLAAAGSAAVLMLLCGVYVLNDICYTNRTAFVSYDLLQYRPAPQGSEAEAGRTFSELRELNADTVGWLELFGTHINYPVMQGADDLEYLNRDIFGYQTLSGSIYLSAENDGAFDDWYNIVYGHHMDNGAMFGDIEKYLDPEFFAAHSEGILQTAKGDYKIQTIACIRTNAYEDIIYQVQEAAESKYPALYDYIKAHSAGAEDLPESIGGEQILGFSTCSDAVTDGRIVLFASVRPWDTAVDGNAAARMVQAEPEPAPILPKWTAKGHSFSGGQWAILNLLCVLCTFLTLLPLWALRTKFGQLSYARRIIRTWEHADSEPDSREAQEAQQCIHDLRFFLRKSRIGLLAEGVLLLVSVIGFLMTEDWQGRMVIRDAWTGWMLLLAACALTADVICLRYRGKRPAQS